MKKMMAVLMAALALSMLASCQKTTPTEKPEEKTTEQATTAAPTEAPTDEPTEAEIPAKQEIGKGAKTFTMTVTDADQKEYELTIHTDKTTVGEALSEYGLADISDGFLTAILGMEASWEKDKAYWAFYINGDFAMTGVNDTDIEDGGKYALVYTK
ncbi:MAG: DUF4430 domain-containing protein [Lachnospiraceae bacterium]|nr:DUF4430 domain-containing protein [Lachnospiraceae bacterium]MBR5340157.1 DUF4430 domain-containing protein [Lachnospiraceae bacterium]